MEPWIKISRYITSFNKGDVKKFIKYIKHSHAVLENNETNDAIAKMFRSKKSLDNERVPKFPFAFLKISKKELNRMEKDH